jgi:hypothetical protein
MAHIHNLPLIEAVKSEQALLDFWEMCNTFLIKTKKQSPHTRLEPKILELEAW